MPVIASTRRLLNESTSDRVADNSHDDVNAPLISSLRLQATCVCAGLIAAIIFTLTEHDDHQHSWWCAFEIGMQIVMAVLGTVYFRLRARLYPDTSILLPPLLMVAAFSLLCEPIQRLFFNTGHSFEVLIMHSQCNLMLALAACGFRLGFQRLSLLIAIFLTIFSCTISNARGLVPLTILFAIAALGWLVLSWWESVDRRLAQTERKSRPLLWAAISFGCLSLAVLPSLGFGANSLTNALDGFMPSSGGNGSYDPFSRGGVNDGDALVAGNNNIKSFAPLDDAPFVESTLPSLYDVFNDQFDGPPKKIKDQQRAIALPPAMMKHIHQKMAEARQAGREFSLVREERIGNKQEISDLNSPALFYVAGPVPARFRMQVLEHFDGITWYPLEPVDEENHLQNFARIQQVEDRHWLKISPVGRAFEVHEGTATHSVKVANLDGNVIPSPPQLVGVNIAHVDRKDMYSVAKTGIASLQRKSVPPMTPINLVSEYVKRERMQNAPLLFRANIKPSVTRALPETESTLQITRLAKEWTNGIPRGWRQVTAIEDRLRDYCVLDRDAGVAEDSTTPVIDFLFKARRGPEYLFAASAACMLRSLNYPSRVVRGFYAPPENYDSRKQHTAVFGQNAHFWCEVLVGMNTWITIEPSPGYEISQPPPGFWTRIWNRIVAGGKFVVDHAIASSFVAACLVLLLIYRRLLHDLMLTLSWNLTRQRSPEQRALLLGALIERRLQLARLNRKEGTTLRRRARQDIFEPVRKELTRVADIADFAKFGDGKSEYCDDGELNRLATALSYRRLRKLPRDHIVAQAV